MSHRSRRGMLFQLLFRQLFELFRLRGDGPNMGPRCPVFTLVFNIAIANAGRMLATELDQAKEANGRERKE